MTNVKSSQDHSITTTEICECDAPVSVRYALDVCRWVTPALTKVKFDSAVY